MTAPGRSVWLLKVHRGTCALSFKTKSIGSERGRSDHYGLGGMRERAKAIGARLEIWSGTGEGTEIDLSIPASLGYSASAARLRCGLFKRESRIRNGSGRHPGG